MLFLVVNESLADVKISPLVQLLLPLLVLLLLQVLLLLLLLLFLLRATACNASSCLSHHLGIRPSVCLSHCSIVSK